MAVAAEETEQRNLSVKERVSLFAGCAPPTPCDQVKVVKNQRKPIGPKFVTPLVGVMIEPNSLVEMEAIIDGNSRLQFQN